MNVIHVKIYPHEVQGVQIISLNYNHGHNVLILFDSYQICFLPQVKRSVVISCKLPHELPNDLRLRIFEN